MRAWERGCNLRLICLHFLLLIGFYFSKVHDDSSAIRNLCCASVILSIHTHPWPLHPWLKNIFFIFFVKYIYQSVHTASLVPSHLSILSMLDYLLLKLTLHETIFQAEKVALFSMSTKNLGVSSPALGCTRTLRHEPEFS